MRCGSTRGAHLGQLGRKADAGAQVEADPARKVALAITASPYEQQPQIFKQVLDALIETCRKQGWSGQEIFDYVGAYGDLLIASWSQETGPH